MPPFATATPPFLTVCSAASWYRLFPSVGLSECRLPVAPPPRSPAGRLCRFGAALGDVSPRDRSRPRVSARPLRPARLHTALSLLRRDVSYRIPSRRQFVVFSDVRRTLALGAWGHAAACADAR
ncbi:hypothetical protein NDU88_006402 [Pleurodeles waltl]|nr:hypothetical protein NDU88_006402 [Pleurodeles waltl]